MIDTAEIRRRIHKEFLSNAEVEKICDEIDRLNAVNRSLHDQIEHMRNEIRQLKEERDERFKHVIATNRKMPMGIEK